jgi:hypothetical protein
MTTGQPSPPTILEVFPPGRRRQMVLKLAERPDFDLPEWTGSVTFRCFKTDKAGRVGLAMKVETDEEVIL